MFTALWQNLKSPERLSDEMLPSLPTTVDESTIKRASPTASCRIVPWSHSLRPVRNAVHIGVVDWSTAEALAFGTLCLEKHLMRPTGRMSNKEHSGNVMRFAPPDHWRILVPLNNVAEDQARFEVENSPLSEFGALDFKYGGTLAAPNSLVMWESQFEVFN
ncbi:hypothetical protein FOWG_04416 [Fusarium oxysporum f. sp. lycopersici MN25]|nr:hypothetical protein FOZG_14596 [Fusarium oxysporum Fo47]EWZ94034.1 hypothetical protein FOWG_04416 [Fusarium oxysporum f. sp. lycopersici MN25]